MKIRFLEAPYDGEVKLCKDTLDYLKENNIKTIGLYASIQFAKQLNAVKEQLKNFNVITSQPDRTTEQHQLLGCDCFNGNLNLKENVDCFLYIGDGKFQPLALVYGQKDAKEFIPVVCNDPITNSMTLLYINHVQKIMKAYKASLMKFLTAKTIGIIVSVKQGQQQYKASKAIEAIYPDKQFYYFVDDDISFGQLENFPFVETWVNTACPRIGFDDQQQFSKGVINLSDALQANDLLSKASLMNTL